MIVIPNEGARRLLELTMRAALVVDETFNLRLFKNDLTPDADTVLGDFVEATFSGYYRRDLARSAWSAPATVGTRAVVEHTGNPLVFSAGSGSQVIYGYYVYSPVSGAVAWCERFDVPRTVAPGSPLFLVVKFAGRAQS